MKNILYIKSTSVNDVRMSKFYHCYLENPNIAFNYWGWDRNNKEKKEAEGIIYFFKGIHLNLVFSYILYIIKLFYKLLFSNLQKYDDIICVNFESALPMFWVSRIKRISFIYEFYDEFSKSYRFPLFIKRRLRKRDESIVKRAKYVIHVDSNRIFGPEKDKTIIIENTPNDYWRGASRSYSMVKQKYAIVGFFSDARGMEQIYKFIVDNKNLRFLLAGRFTNEIMKEQFSNLDNVEFHDFMPQEQLYKLMEECCAIFSLYNPNLEINRFAASNKVYDAMMMGIPVITNKEVINSGFIKQHNIGFIIDYDYNETWSCLTSDDFMDKMIELGSNGRALYLSNYQFSALVEKRLLPVLFE